MAVIERFGGDLRDAIHGSGYTVADGVMSIEHFQKIIVDRKAGVILSHADLLGDDALLLLHGLVGKVRSGDEMQQHAQVFFKALGTLEVVAGDARRGEGVGVGPVCREDIQGTVAVRQVEHLVFEIVGHARRSIELAPVHGEAAAGTAIIGGKGSIEGGKVLLRHHAHLKTVVKNGGKQRFADTGIIKLLYLHLPYPFLHPRRTGNRPCPVPRSLRPQ